MLQGKVIAQMDHFAPENGQLPTSEVSPTQVAHYSQNRLMSLLWEEAKRICTTKNWHFGPAPSVAGAPPPQAGVILGQSFRSLVDKGDSVSASFGPVAPASNNSNNNGLNLEAKTLVACDGAHSTVRTKLGINLGGKAGLQHLINIHFRSANLARRIREHPEGGRSSMLYFVFNTRAIVVVVAHDLQLGEFVAQVPYYPPQQMPEDYTEARCRELVEAAVFGSSAPEPSVLSDLTIDTVRPWAMSALVAESYTRGNVALVGDAAHQFPPAGGFGMNTGIADAHNLAWKLAMLYQGIGNKQVLLTSYGNERKPVAESNAALSMRNFDAATAVPSSLGLDPTAADYLVGGINALSAPLAFIPRSARKLVLDSALGVARGLASEALLDESTAIGRSRVAAARRVLKEGRSLRLLFPNADLGYVYGSRSEDRRLDYIPRWEPGARLPHMELAVVSAPGPGLRESAAKVISSIDLIAAGINNGRPAFTILSVNEQLLEQLKVELQSEIPKQFILLTSDQTEDVTPSAADYVLSDTKGIFPVDLAAVVVRPDGHVLHVVSRNFGEGAAAGVARAMDRYLGIRIQA